MALAPTVSSRLRYWSGRLARFSPVRVGKLAGTIGREQDKWAPAVFVDMLWWAAFHDTAFSDYYEADFASLRPAERKTFMTSMLQYHLAKRLNDEGAAWQLRDKLRFNRRFADFVRRDWIDLRETGADGLKEFCQRHPVIIGKIPVSRSGLGVERYETTPETDFAALHAELVEKGQILVEERIAQHPYLAGYCEGTVNSTRVLTYFDGERVHPLAMVQKFGRGAACDQSPGDGFFTMLDEHGHSTGPGISGAHAKVYPVHPDSGKSIPDFQVPMWDDVLAMVDEVSRVVPEVPYVGWDIVVTPDGPLVLEGNWIPGLYETRAHATGIRTGTRLRHEAVIPR